MRLSVFTPTHLPDYLPEAYISLLRQKHTNWEWVIVPNGGNAVIPDNIRRDNRVKIVEGGEHLYNIGAIKRLACDHCSGEAFIELDHDDLLFPGNSLSAIEAAFEQGAGFVYSDTALFTFDSERKGNNYGKFMFSPAHGWEHYAVNVYGRDLLATRAFDISPRSLCEIYYAPDHVRCWSRKAYYDAGGHNRELSVIDDHELMIKTYLSGVPFVHTGGSHYLYRSYKHNTVHGRQRQIRELTRKFKIEYTEDLISEWVSREDYDVLNIDDLVASGWQWERDLQHGFGFDCYGAVKANDFLQWMDGDRVSDFMNSVYDALVPGGYLIITVPDAIGGIGFADPAYKSYYSEASMLPYINKKHADKNGHISARFQLVLVTDEYASDWHKSNEYKQLRFHLCALKGQRQPGTCDI